MLYTVRLETQFIVIAIRSADAPTRLEYTHTILIAYITRFTRRISRTASLDTFVRFHITHIARFTLVIFVAIRVQWHQRGYTLVLVVAGESGCTSMDVVASLDTGSVLVAYLVALALAGLFAVFLVRLPESEPVDQEAAYSG